MERRPLRRNPEFLALWTGQAVSALGTSISSLAYPLLVLAVTGSPAQAGLVGSMVAITTFVVRLPAGVVADRVDRRRLMLACDAGRILVVGSVAAAVWFDFITLPHLLAAAVVEGALGSLFAPAEAVAVRRVVPAEQLRDAVATSETRRQLAALVGPSAGGVLFGWGRAWPFVADTLSYLLSFIAVLTIRTPLHPSNRRPAPDFRAELAEGLRWLWSQPFLRDLALWLSAAGALFTSMGLITLVLAQDLGASAAETGLMFTISGVGGLLGALACPWLLRRLTARAIVVAYGWTAAGASFLLLAADSIWLLGLVGAAAFFPVPVVNALLQSRLAETVPDVLHGRVFTATTQLTTLLHPVGPATAGIALQSLGAGTTVPLYGVLFTVLALVVSVRRFEAS